MIVIPLDIGRIRGFALPARILGDSGVLAHGRPYDGILTREASMPTCPIDLALLSRHRRMTTVAQPKNAVKNPFLSFSGRKGSFTARR
jgi:hypothetical protein